MIYAIHDQEGRIRCIFDAPTYEIAEAQCSAGEIATSVLSSTSNLRHWINPSTGRANKRDVTPCTPSRSEIPADGDAVLTLSQMRPGTVVTVTGPVSSTMTVEQGGSDTIRFHKPGTYTITAEAPFPAMPKEITINAA